MTGLFDTSDIVRKHMAFRGFVQGVGFRYRARQAASMYGCTGWVRNEHDGSVTMEIQGTEEAIDRVLIAIQEGRYVMIRDMSVETIAPVRDDYGFRTS